MRVVTVNEDKTVISIKWVREDYVLQENEFVTEVGELGQIRQENGTFITPIKEQIEVEPTISAEEIQLQTLLNTEYLVTMTQINNI